MARSPPRSPPITSEITSEINSEMASGYQTLCPSAAAATAVGVESCCGVRSGQRASRHRSWKPTLPRQA